MTAWIDYVTAEGKSRLYRFQAYFLWQVSEIIYFTWNAKPLSVTVYFQKHFCSRLCSNDSGNIDVPEVGINRLFLIVLLSFLLLSCIEIMFKLPTKSKI